MVGRQNVYIYLLWASVLLTLRTTSLECHLLFLYRVGFIYQYFIVFISYRYKIEETNIQVLFCSVDQISTRRYLFFLCSQYHQHFKRSFFVPKCFVQLFLVMCQLCNFWRQNFGVKCWWNWPTKNSESSMPPSIEVEDKDKCGCISDLQSVSRI